MRTPATLSTYNPIAFKGSFDICEELGTTTLNEMINTIVLDSYAKDRLNR